MQEVLKEIKAFLDARGWFNQRPSDTAKSIVIEGAELLELFQWDSLTAEETRADKWRMERLRKEIADVLIYTLHLALLLELDPLELIRVKLALNNDKYPVEEMRKRQEGKRTHSGDDSYIKIKQEHRECATG